MTDKQINDIANIISAKVIEFIEQKQQEFDKEWLSAHESQDDEDYLMSKLAQLLTKLDKALQSENYEKCALIKRDIIKIENQLKNL
jgi:protein-arginine kinase activator protein McsA